MARNITIREAIREAFDQEMERDSTVILMGEDIVGGAGSPGEDDAWGGVMGIHKGLFGKYGKRMLDTNEQRGKFAGLLRRMWQQLHESKVAFKSYGLYRVWADIPDYNVAAKQLFENLGFVHEGTLRKSRPHAGMRHDSIIMGMLATEFLNS